jgi:hypothetical protein
MTRYSEFMNAVRYWDNQVAKWMLRHFYFLFFQFVLIAVFIIWFMNLIAVINSTLLSFPTSSLEKLLATQSVNTTIIVFLMMMNSFWILYMFNTMMRIHTSLKDISYNTSRIRRNN